MERTLRVKGTALGTIIFKGVAFYPKQTFDLIMTDNEYNAYKGFIQVGTIEEVGVPEPPKSEPIVEKPKEEIIEPKGEDDGKPIKNSRNKVPTKKQV